MPRTPARPRRSAPAATRTFLFSDLRGYTDFVERNGDGAAARLIRDYRTLVRREVARHAGAEVKTEGDSFYVVFDAAGAALDCAVAIQRRAEAHRAKEPTRPIGVGIGLHSGETVALERQFVGSAVNVAARLAAQAGPGEIVASDTLRGIVRTATDHPLTDRGALTLKGVAEPVRAWTVEWREPARPALSAASTDEATPPVLPAATAALPTAASGQLVCPTLVGRQAELDSARRAIAAAAAGRGQTVVLSGEAGVGKSAYVREVVAHATPLGFRLLYGATLESDRGLPYAPFVSAIHSGFRGLERDRLGAVLARAAPDLAQLFPELARPGAQAMDQPRLAYAFAGLIATFAREAPVLLAIEDLHWADDASLALVEHLARELRDQRALLLATHRSDELHRRHPLLRTLAALQRERLATEVALGRLGPEQVRELIRRTFAEADPDVRVDDEFLDAIHARGEGNPFFTEELLKSLVASGDVYLTESGWQRKEMKDLQIPGSIREAVRQRVAGLSPDARATVAIAAAIGLQFDFELLQAARDVDESALEAHLHELIEGQLVVEVPGPDERYAFRHALSKEVVYDDLLARERKRLHRSVAAALTARRASEPALLAHHLLAAGDLQAAVPHLLAAAERAQASGAPREAAAHYGRAIEIGVPDDALASVVERQARAYFAFDQDLALKAAREAGDLYRERGDHRGRSRMVLLEGRLHFYATRFSDAYRVFQEAIDVLEGEDCVERAQALSAQAALAISDFRPEQALQLVEPALESGRRHNDPWTLAFALVTKGSALPPTDEAVALIREGIAIAERHGIPEGAGRGYNGLAIALRRRLDPSSAMLPVIERGLEHGRRHGLERAALAHLLSMRSFCELCIGQWDAALGTLAQVDLGSPVGFLTLQGRETIARARGGPAAASEPLAALAEMTGTAGDGIRALAGPLLAMRAHLLAGDVVAARSAAAPLLDPARPAGRALDQVNAQYIFEAAQAGAFLRAPDMVAKAEARIRDEPIDVLPRAAVAAARGVLAGDGRATGAALASRVEVVRRAGLVGFFADSDLVWALICVHHGLGLGPEWRPILEEIREFARLPGVRATWWESETERLLALC